MVVQKLNYMMEIRSVRLGTNEISHDYMRDCTEQWLHTKPRALDARVVHF